MRVLICQPVPPRHWENRRDYVDAVARLGARLRETGHEPSLLVLDHFDEDALRLKIADVRPDHLVVYLESFHVDLVRRLAEHVANRYYLPIIVGGPHATVAPHRVLSMIGVEGVVLGEWDRAVPEYLEARRLGGEYAATPGFWFQGDAGLVRNPMARPETPEEMVPLPDRSLYSAEQVVDPRGLAELHVTRGCTHYCAHCQMDLAAGLYEEHQFQWLRRRPIDAVMAEIEHLRTAYPMLRGLRIAGCVMPLETAYLSEFAEALSGPSRIPFTARVKTGELTAEMARLLKAAGCFEVELEVLSGSDFIRNDIFQLDLSEDQVLGAFAAAREADLRTRALVHVGLPYDTVVTMEQTGELLRRAGADAVEVRIFYPLPGTKACELCQENGWLSGRDPAEYFRGASPLDLPGLDAETIRRYAVLIPHLVHHPKAWPLLMRLERVRLGRRHTLADLVAPMLGQRWSSR